uniref:Secreted protein n=1 Tax=Octopus bimaculoides TaxID=37653 RepID=A0A0L8FNJ3_OCTBM
MQINRCIIICVCVCMCACSKTHTQTQISMHACGSTCQTIMVVDQPILELSQSSEMKFSLKKEKSLSKTPNLHLSD